MRPVLRCFAARLSADGRIGRAEIVSLGEAYLLFAAGTHAIVGPDPDDEAALAAWEREQAPEEDKARRIADWIRLWNQAL